jgi:XTP/dITP diphosphohydrolase
VIYKIKIVNGGMTDMQAVIIATNNPGKRKEIQALLSDLPVQVVTPRQIGLELEVEEDGQNYAENAARKALAFARASGLIALGDDSGLEVDPLGGLPGLRSARFAPQPGASDADRRKYLLEQLREIPRPWTAHFHCTVALARPDGEVRYAEGDCWGEIIPEERGEQGFGYDPIFWIPEEGKTMAELSLEKKNLLSHRANAVQTARPLLLAWLEDNRASG